MRRWLLILMLVLLPLRGWVGEAMAGDMLRQHGMPMATQAKAAGHAQHVSVPHCHEAVHAGQDCGKHAAPAASAPDAGSHAAGHAPTCASCQACSSVALGPCVFAPEPVRFSHPRPLADPVTFTSAEPALAFKPPRG